MEFSRKYKYLIYETSSSTRLYEFRAPANKVETLKLAFGVKWVRSIDFQYTGSTDVSR